MSYKLLEAGSGFDDVIKRLEDSAAHRLRIEGESARALRAAKRAIFALQRRGDVAEATNELAGAGEKLAGLQQQYGGGPLRVTSGPWKVAAEEYLEALFFLRFFQGRPLDLHNDEFYTIELDGEQVRLSLGDEAVFGGLSDMTGEIGRQMQMWIQEGNYAEAIRGNRAIAEAVEFLNLSTAGGNLRRKVDQANGNLSRSDGRLTDLKIRGLI